MIQKLKRNWFVVLKSTWGIWRILIRSLKSPITLNGLLLASIYNIWDNEVQRNYLSWHWKVMQNLTKKWLVVWKMTLGIWQILTRALKSVKIGTLMGSFCPKWKMYELKIYRAAICHDNEEWCKIWRGIDLSFRNGYKEFDKSWPEDLKI